MIGIGSSKHRYAAQSKGVTSNDIQFGGAEKLMSVGYRPRKFDPGGRARYYLLKARNVGKEAIRCILSKVAEQRARARQWNAA